MQPDEAGWPDAQQLFEVLLDEPVQRRLARRNTKGRRRP
jgi:hypothetical protein